MKNTILTILILLPFNFVFGKTLEINAKNTTAETSELIRFETLFPSPKNASVEIIPAHVQLRNKIVNENGKKGKEIIYNDLTGNELIGIYKTDFDELTLYINGNKVTGTYKYQNGRVEGILSGKKLVGTWTQSNGKGRMEFVFSDDFSSFQGKWGYNETTPSSKWNGTRIGSSGDFTGSFQKVNPSENTKINGTYKTDFDEMTLQINGNKVTGTYKYQNGRVEGILSGQKLVGTWTQSNGKGRMEFVFSDDFSSFQGKWGYNETAPSSKWNGTKTN